MASLSQQESLSKYGTVAYTAWDQESAQQDWQAKHGASPAQQQVLPTGQIPQATPSGTPQNLPAQAGGASSLEQVLIQRGGYNPTDARNAATGPRAMELAKEFGVDLGGTGMGLGNQPTIDLNALYESNYNSPEVQKLNADITAQQKARDEAESIINDNPFYSEATRVGKIAKLTEQYNDKITTLQNERAMKLADAEIKVNLAMKQYDINNQAYKDQLDIFNNILSAGGLSNATGQEIAAYAVATGIPTSAIQGIIEKQKRDEIKPQVTTQTDDYGNVTIAAVDANTGELLYKTNLGSIGNAQNGGGAGGVGSKNLQSLKADVQGWMNLTELAKKYVGVFSKDQILSVYNTFHSNDAWGAAKESSEDLNKIFGISKAGGVESLTPDDKSNVNQIKDDIKNGLYTREQAAQYYPEYAPYF